MFINFVIRKYNANFIKADYTKLCDSKLNNLIFKYMFVMSPH